MRAIIQIQPEPVNINNFKRKKTLYVFFFGEREIKSESNATNVRRGKDLSSFILFKLIDMIDHANLFLSPHFFAFKSRGMYVLRDDDGISFMVHALYRFIS